MLTVLAMLALPAVARGFCFRKNLINKNRIEKFLFNFFLRFRFAGSLFRPSEVSRRSSSMDPVVWAIDT